MGFDRRALATVLVLLGSFFLLLALQRHRKTGTVAVRQEGLLLVGFARRAVGTVLVLLGYVVLLLGLQWGVFWGTRFGLVGLVVMIAGGGGGVWIGVTIGRLGRRLSTEDAKDVLRLDERPPIVYLRSFKEDGAATVSRPDHPSDKLLAKLPMVGIFLPDALHALRLIGWSTDEEWIEGLFAQLGPVIALGLPKEKLRHAGAARIYAGSAWQQAVGELIDKAQLVVLRIGDSPGLNWELEEAVGRLKPHQILLFLTFRQDRKELWERFRQSTRQTIPGELPEDVRENLFLRFGPDWTPDLLGHLGSDGSVLSPEFVIELISERLPVRRSRKLSGPQVITRSLAYGTAALVPIAAVAAPVLHSPSVAISLIAALAVAGAVIARLARHCGAWHSAQVGRYAIGLSVIGAYFWYRAFPSLAQAAEESCRYLPYPWCSGEMKFWTTVIALLVLCVVLYPTWVLSALRKDGLRD